MREGDRVVAGQSVIARVDAGPREIQLREARAAVRRAREVVYSLGLDAERALAGRWRWRRAPALEVSERRGGV